MSVFSIRFAGLLAVLAIFGLTSCSKPVSSTSARSSEFYWSAAKETFEAGDYTKTIEHLDRLIDDRNPYTHRALPWSLVLTSGMAGGYMDLADHYTAGARVKKTEGMEFRRKAADYRAIASTLALRFAQAVDHLQQLPPGSVQLAFPLPLGNAALPPQLAHIGKGIQLSPEDTAAAETLAIQRSVLLTACLAAGAPNDIARGDRVLGRAIALTPRATFAAALSKMLTRESALFSRDQLDQPQKLASLKQRAQIVVAWASQPAGTAIALDRSR